MDSKPNAKLIFSILFSIPLIAASFVSAALNGVTPPQLREDALVTLNPDAVVFSFVPYDNVFTDDYKGMIASKYEVVRALVGVRFLMPEMHMEGEDNAAFTRLWVRHRMDGKVVYVTPWTMLVEEGGYAYDYEGQNGILRIRWGKCTLGEIRENENGTGSLPDYRDLVYLSAENINKNAEYSNSTVKDAENIKQTTPTKIPPEETNPPFFHIDMDTNPRSVGGSLDFFIDPPPPVDQGGSAIMRSDFSYRYDYRHLRAWKRGGEAVEFGVTLNRLQLYDDKIGKAVYSTPWAVLEDNEKDDGSYQCDYNGTAGTITICWGKRILIVLKEDELKKARRSIEIGK